MNAEAADVPGAIVNLDYLKELSGGNQSFEKEMIDLFMDQMPSDITVLKEANETADFSGLKSIAHKMKSSVSVVGANQLMTYLEQIEKHAGAGEMTAELTNNIESVIRYTDKCYGELNTILTTVYSGVV